MNRPAALQDISLFSFYATHEHDIRNDGYNGLTCRAHRLVGLAWRRAPNTMNPSESIEVVQLKALVFKLDGRTTFPCDVFLLITGVLAKGVVYRYQL